VNCVVNGGTSDFARGSLPLSETPTDLCNENGITGYPEMQLYHDGVLQVTFEGARTYERVMLFIEEHTGASKPSYSVPPPELPEHDVQTLHNERNPHGEVLTLTPDSFASVVADGDVFIKFFAPWWVLRLLGVTPCGC
jgi:hypothetical protein